MARIRTGCGRTTRRAVSVVAGRVRVYRGTRFSPITVMVKDSLARRAPDAGTLDRRLTLIGSYIDSVSQAAPVSITWLMKGLDEFLERDQDRALFDLAPKGASH